MPRSGLARASGSGSSRGNRFDGGCAAGRLVANHSNAALRCASELPIRRGMTFGIQTRPRPRFAGGLKGDARVGVMLDGLRRESFHVLHDVELTDEGTIDHLVTGPTGVFLIATTTDLERDAAKARRQATRLHDVLDVWVAPVICLPERRGRPPHKHEGVWIVRRDHLPNWLRTQHNEVIEFARLARLADQL